MPFCENCGEEITGEGKHCSNCGLKLPKKLVKKAKKAVIKDLDVVMIIDESGSMFGQRRDVITGVDKFVEEQLTVEGNVFLTIHTLDGARNPKIKSFPRVNIKDYKGIEYSPGGGTPLNDGIGHGINQAIKDKLGNTIFVIITDGAENDSTEFDGPSIKALIKKVESEHDWKFSYMFSGLDYESSRRHLSNYGASMSAGSMQASVKSASSSFSSDVKRYRSAGGNYMMSSSMAEPEDGDSTKLGGIDLEDLIKANTKPKKKQP